MTLRTALVALALSLTLSACSGPPSVTQAQGAMARQYEQASGEPDLVKGFDNFALSGCKEDQNADGYRCDISGEVVMTMFGTEQRLPLSGPVRFSKASGEWMAHKATP